jgi:hypothetical protein
MHSITHKHFLFHVYYLVMTYFHEHYKEVLCGQAGDWMTHWGSSGKTELAMKFSVLLRILPTNAKAVLSF